MRAHTISNWSFDCSSHFAFYKKKRKKKKKKRKKVRCVYASVCGQWTMNRKQHTALNMYQMRKTVVCDVIMIQFQFFTELTIKRQAYKLWFAFFLSFIHIQVYDHIISCKFLLGKKITSLYCWFHPIVIHLISSNHDLARLFLPEKLKKK